MANLLINRVYKVLYINVFVAFLEVVKSRTTGDSGSLITNKIKQGRQQITSVGVNILFCVLKKNNLSKQLIIFKAKFNPQIRYSEFVYLELPFLCAIP